MMPLAFGFSLIDRVRPDRDALLERIKMKIARLIGIPCAALFTAAAVVTALCSAALAAGAYDINVVLPLTGSAAFVGQGERDSLLALQDQINATGGNLNFIFHDDQTQPQLAVQLTTQVVGSQPAVVMGSSLVAMCLAMAPLMENGPVQYCLSPGIHPKGGSYVFSTSSSSTDQIAAVVRYYRMMGWTKVATLMTTDASGQDGDRSVAEVLQYGENKGKMDLLVQEHFNPSDVSVAAQMARIKGSGAQAIIAWTTGAPAATVFRSMAQQGIDLPVAPTSGNQTFAAMKQWQAFLPKQLILASALYPPHPGSVKLDPGIESAQQAMYAALAKRGLKADNMVATTWDAGLIVAAALRKLGNGATAAQLREYIDGLTDFAGVDGTYNFKKYPQRGLGPEASTVTTYDAKSDSWVWLSQPGGEPLSK
jgi:branched-chain amino acid transport system substrate-binding protein